MARCCCMRTSLVHCIIKTHSTFPKLLPRRPKQEETMVNIPKERNTFCKGKACKKHTVHKVRGPMRSYSQWFSSSGVIV